MTGKSIKIVGRIALLGAVWLAVLAFPGTVLGQSASGIGLHAAPFLRISPTARAVSLGEAYSAIDDEITGLRYNPASIGTLSKPMVAVHFHNWISDTKQGNIAVALPTKFGVFGVDFTYFDEGAIVELDENFQPTGGSSYSDDLALTLGYANRLNILKGQLRMGTSLRLLRQNLIGEQSSASGLDFGLNYRYRFLSLGAAVQNVGLARIKFKRAAATLPRTIRLGSAFQLPVHETLAVNLALDALSTADEKWRFYTGTECIISDLVALRAGLKLNQIEASRWSAGFGLNMPAEWLAGARMRFDYAYSPLEDFDEAAHRFGLVFKFGVAKSSASELNDRLRQELAAAEQARLSAQEAEERTRQLEEEVGNRLARIKQIAAESQGKIEVEPKSREKILVSMRINFDFDQARIRPEDAGTMHQVAEILKTYPEARVQLSGHTDNIGADEYNIRLSQRRIDSVMVFLIRKEKIERQKFFMPVGYGESKPIASNATDQGRFRNRRVEFLLYTLDASPEMPEGTAIKAVEIATEKMVRIICNGKVKFKYETMDNPDRLVIDFPGIYLLNDVTTYELNSGAFIRARMAYHPELKYTRVVFDLKRKIDAEVENLDNLIVIRER